MRIKAIFNAKKFKLCFSHASLQRFVDEEGSGYYTFYYDSEVETYLINKNRR
jgi:hypothetical protein